MPVAPAQERLDHAHPGLVADPVAEAGVARVELRRRAGGRSRRAARRPRRLRGRGTGRRRWRAPIRAPGRCRRGRASTTSSARRAAARRRRPRRGAARRAVTAAATTARLRRCCRAKAGVSQRSRSPSPARWKRAASLASGTGHGLGEVGIRASHDVGAVAASAAPQAARSVAGGTGSADPGGARSAPRTDAGSSAAPTRRSRAAVSGPRNGVRAGSVTCSSLLVVESDLLALAGIPAESDHKRSFQF